MIIVTWTGAFNKTVARLFSCYENIPHRYLRPEWGASIKVLAWPSRTYLIEDMKEFA